MDGIHDLGGKQGFGPVDVHEPDAPFHHDWEARMWAIARTCHANDWTIDWWRHVRENIDPVDYLTRSYFDQWAQTYSTAFILSGVFTPDEVITGRSREKGTPAPAISVEETLDQNRDSNSSFARNTTNSARYQVGDRVCTRATGHSGHDRLPQYARGKIGVIHAHHGAHVLPDSSAAGGEDAQHVYTVRFDAEELWGQEGHPGDHVQLDLFESYLSAQA